MDDMSLQRPFDLDLDGVDLPMIRSVLSPETRTSIPSLISHAIEHLHDPDEPRRSATTLAVLCRSA